MPRTKLQLVKPARPPKRMPKKQAKRAGMCTVPRCRRYIDGRDGFPRGNIKRGLCSRCASARSYWRSKVRKNPAAMAERQQRLVFLNGRFNWLIENVEDEE